MDRIPLKADPQSVAELGYEAMRDGRIVAVHGLINKLVVAGLRVVPRFLVRGVMNLVQGGPLRNRSANSD